MTSPLLQRVLTAAVLIPLVMWVVLGLDTVVFAALLLAVIALAAWEWSRLAGLHGVPGRGVYLLVMVALTAGLGWLYDSGHELLPLLYLALAFWLWALWMVLRYPRSAGLFSQAWLVALLALPVLSLSWLAAVMLHGDERGPMWVLVVLVLIWTADSAAFFAGRRWGKHKLAPQVSPGKSWEGLWGGLVGVAVGLLGLVWYLDAGLASAGFLLGLGLVTALVSVLGDLFESVLKRSCGVKDSGSLLPGHGGILDRIDSFTAAAPLFALGILAWAPTGHGS